jgi:hypothetical protein
MATGGPFPQDALEANRANRLTDQQRTWLRTLAKNSRSVGWSIAGVSGGLGVILLFFADRGGSTRVLAGVGALIVAGFFAVRSLTGADPLDKDLRSGYVESVEGAITKRSVTTHGRSSSTTTHYIDVENKQMVAFRDQYDAAPEAGYVRVYYVPNSMRVVNLEHLPDRAVPAGVMKSPRDMLKLAASGLVGIDEVKKAEARAEMAAIGHAMQPGAPPPDSERDPRPLAEALIGKWTNGMVTITFNVDGTAALALRGGMERQAQWSVDAQGRLVADVMGEKQTSDAWIAGDRLSIKLGGEGIVLDRA